MIGTSYNGSLPIAAAATGVAGLEAIVPISPVSDYYEYYRANGMVRGPGGWQGEDADVLVDVVYTRQDETYPRMICRALIEQIGRDQDRVTGDRNAFWDERNLNALVPNMHAAVLLAHGNNDNNVMTKNATAFYEAVKKAGPAAPVLLPPGRPRRRAAGRDGQPLVHALPLRRPATASRRCRSRGSCGESGAPARRAQSTVAGAVDQLRRRSPSPTRAPFPLGFTLTIPQTRTAITGTRVITNIAGNTLTLATRRGHRRRQRARRSAWCAATRTRRRTPSGRTRRPRPSRRSSSRARPGAAALSFAATPARNETLTDNAPITATTSMNAATLRHAARLPDQRAHAAGADQRHAVAEPADGVQQAEGQPHRHPDQLPGRGRQRDDPVARLAGPGEPRLDVPRRDADHARHVLRPDASTCSPRTWSSRPDAGWRS